MAEGIEFPVIPERTKLEGGGIRRNSTGKTNTSNSGGKILPHYLRASTSSCHDFCKFGRKHAFEEKAKNRVPKGTKSISSQNHDPPKSMNLNLAWRHKKTVAKPKPSPEPKTRLLLPDTSRIIKREVTTPSKKVVNVSVKQILSPSKETDASARSGSTLKPKSKAITPSSYSLTPPGVSSVSTLKLKPKAIKPSSSSLTPPGVLSVSTLKLKPKAIKPSSSSLFPKPSVNRVASLNGGKQKNLKVAPRKIQNKVIKAEPKQPSDEKVEEKTLYVIEQTENKSVEPTQNESFTAQLNPSSTSSSSLSSFMPSSPKTSLLPSLHAEEEHEESESTVSETSASSITEYDESESESESEIQRGISEGEENYKGMLRRGATVDAEVEDCSSQKLNFRRGKVIDVQSQNNNPRRLRFRRGRVLDENQDGKGGAERRSLRRRRREMGNGESNGDKLESEKVVLKHQGMPRRGATVDAEGEDCSSQKLNFRRGKVIDLQSQNNNPRRLRFRRGRVLDENQDGKGGAERRSLRRRRREMGDGESNGDKLESEKVVLKHQGVQGKKDAQGLFNNVIEETASKLVETRRGKVKALVGAFETVISLQERKPSTTSSS